MKNENLSEWNEHDIFIVTSLSENSKLREWELFFRWILGELNLSLLKKSNNPCPINSFKMKLYLWDSQQHSAVVLTSKYPQWVQKHFEEILFDFLQDYNIERYFYVLYHTHGVLLQISKLLISNYQDFFSIFKMQVNNQDSFFSC